MLKTEKLFKQLHDLVPHIQTVTHYEREQARALWELLVANPLLAHQASARAPQALVPSWTGDIHTVWPLIKPESYSIVAVDGSQIYPDRHTGTRCFLLNMGTVYLSYTATQGQALLDSVPSVHSAEQLGDSTPEYVNVLRAEKEFAAGLELAQHVKPDLVVYDGSLIFWHLDARAPEIKKRFLSSYLALLDNFYQQKIGVCSYISAPQSKELVQVLVAAGLLSCDYVTDSDIASFFIADGERSGVFGHQGSITQEYPAHLKPHFFYMKADNEIGRVEIPAWIAHEPQYVDRIASLLADQCAKGHGYPLALAEAHEQAVVKGPDRELFYQMLTRVSATQASASQKSVRKRLMHV